MVKASNLSHFAPQLLVATSDTTRLPQSWLQWSGAEQRIFGAEEVERWRQKALRLGKACGLKVVVEGGFDSFDMLWKSSLKLFKLLTTVEVGSVEVAKLFGQSDLI